MWWAVVGALCAVALSRFLWMRWRYDVHKIPAPPGIPFLGQTLDFLDVSQEVTVRHGKWSAALGHPKVMRVDVFGRTLVFVRDQITAKQIILNTKNPFPKASMGTGSFQTLIGNDATTTTLFGTGELTPYVRVVRQVYANGFQSSQLRKATPHVLKVCESLTNAIEKRRKDGPIDFQKLCVQAMVDALGAVVLETNLGGLDESRPIYRRLIESGYIWKEIYFNPFKQAYFKIFPNCKGAKYQRDTLAALSAEWDILTHDVMSRPKPPEGETPFWYALRSIHDPETGKPIIFKNLRAELATAVVAGVDTTGHQLAWILALLARHPRVVDALLTELKEHGLYGPGAKGVTYEDLGELAYLNAIVKEGMRIAIIVTGLLIRSVPEDMTILGYRLPKGTYVSIPGNRWIDTEEEWGDPKVFRPERWISGEDMSAKHYLAFAYGPRDCPGRRLAMLEMRLVVMTVVMQYELKMESSVEELMVKSTNGLAIEAIDGIWLQATPRPPLST